MRSSFKRLTTFRVSATHRINREISKRILNFTRLSINSFSCGIPDAWFVYTEIISVGDRRWFSSFGSIGH